jgi:CRP-like cAMP-binding protein
MAASGYAAALDPAQDLGALGSRASGTRRALTRRPQVEDRVLAYLWHLAGRCGRVTPHGIKLPYRVSHQVLGKIVGAHRPSVTVAIKRLRERNQLIASPDGGYVLVAPAELGRA